MLLIESWNINWAQFQNQHYTRPSSSLSLVADSGLDLNLMIRVSPNEMRVIIELMKKLMLGWCSSVAGHSRYWYKPENNTDYMLQWWSDNNLVAWTNSGRCSSVLWSTYKVQQMISHDSTRWVPIFRNHRESNNSESK